MLEFTKQKEKNVKGRQLSFLIQKMRHVHPGGNHREKQGEKGEMTHVLIWQRGFQLVEQKDAKNELG